MRSTRRVGAVPAIGAHMGRIAFILFLIVAMPIGIHHAFEDPQVGSGFKYLH